MTDQQKNQSDGYPDHEEIYENQLREMRDWYGDWDQARKVIDNLEDNDNEAAYERHYSNLDR